MLLRRFWKNIVAFDTHYPVRGIRFSHALVVYDQSNSLLFRPYLLGITSSLLPPRPEARRKRLLPQFASG